MKPSLNISGILSDLIASFIKALAVAFVGSIGGGVVLYFKSIFFQSAVVPTYFLFFLIVISASFLVLFVLDGYQNKKKEKEKYFIPIKSKFYNESEPSEYSRKTKWNYKDNTNYYYVPLLSHSQFNVTFADLCGPYCATCNHILHTDGGYDMGTRFFCLNCNKKYKIPTELLGDYQKKIFGYFQDEYRQGRLKENTGLNF